MFLLCEQWQQEQQPTDVGNESQTYSSRDQSLLQCALTMLIFHLLGAMYCICAYGSGHS
jgi:hypothetical protein